MCGRFTQLFTWRELYELYNIHSAARNIEPRYNLAPTQQVLVIRSNPETKGRTLDPLRWGLVPSWAKDLTIGSKMINARGEGLTERQAFRQAFKSRRCIIPASGFYEWAKTKPTKTPYAIVPTDGPVFSFAGLWEGWRDKSNPDAEWIHTCTIITGEPNELVAPIHNRMPVILPPEAWPKWLGEQSAHWDELLALLKPYPADRMRAYPVSTRVNSVRNDDASLLEATE